MIIPIKETGVINQWSGLGKFKDLSATGVD